MSTKPESTGHSQHLREVLRAKREARGITQVEVARRIMSYLNDDRHFSGSAVSEWERFQRHPAIDVMAAWARVLGCRLLVDLDEADGARIPVLLKKRTADLARQLDLMSDDDMAIAAQVIERMARRS